MAYFVYILRGVSNELYIGQTNNLQRRENEQLQNKTKAAKFIRDGKIFRLVYFEKFNTRLEAMMREKQLKGWTRAKKEALINGNLQLLKRL